jgi:hypothetical protein
MAFSGEAAAGSREESASTIEVYHGEITREAFKLALPQQR